jgi:hypothetical protein
MTNIKKVAAGIIAGAAITAAPLVAFAAPAFADTGAAKPVVALHEHHEQPAIATAAEPSQREQHVLVNSTGAERHVLVNAASAGSVQGANAAQDDVFHGPETCLLKPHRIWFSWAC